MVCPGCGRLVDVNAAVCPFCEHVHPGRFGYGPAVQRWWGRFELGRAILVACVALYALSLLIDPSALLRFRGLFDLFSPSGRALYLLGMTGGFSMGEGHYWTVITAVFLHGSLLHLGFNLAIANRYLADVVELYGAARTWVIFLVGGIVGFVLSNLASGSPTVGASGAIFALLAALIVYGRRTHQHAVAQQLWLSAAVMFAFGFFMPNVNNWAHAGGFAGGFVAAEAMSFAGRRASRGLTALTWALTLAVPLAFVVQVLTALGLLR